MRSSFQPNGSNRPRWLQRTITGLQRAWNHLQRLVLAQHRQPEPVLIPIRIERPERLRQSMRGTWRE